jgi:hypothetical protein
MWEVLWRRTANLSREYPALWLPVMIADVVGFAAKSAKPIITSHIAQLLFRGHSVLGFETVDHNAARTTFAYGLTIAVVQLVRFAPAALYAAAFLITGRLVIERDAAKLPEERALTKKALLLGLRAYLIAIPLSFVGFAPIYLSFVWPRLHGFATHWLFADLVALLMMSALAYLMIPAALRALIEATMPQPDRASVRLARKCAIAAVVASTGLLILEHIIGGAIYGSHLQFLAVEAIMSLVAALPYTPLYVALSLLARDENVEVSEQPIALVPGEA